MAKATVPFTTPTLTLEQRIANLEDIINRGAWRQTGVDSLVAKAGGGQSGATAITKTLSRFTTVATGGDSAVLPQSGDGFEFTVVNAGAASMNVFPSPAESINAGAANAAFAIGAGKSATFYCITAGVWHTMLSA